MRVPTPLIRPLCALAALAAVSVICLTDDSTSPPAPSTAPATSESRGRASEIVQPAKLRVDPDRPALRALSLPPDAGHSPLADPLHAPERTGGEDTRVVFNLFEHYRKRFGGFPTGEDNATFVNALTGNNPARLPLLDPVHDAINARGELCDRWGTAFFFHLLSHDALEIRSAGPDRKAYTADDFVVKSEKAKLQNFMHDALADVVH
jgi:hypothetical protein